MTSTNFLIILQSNSLRFEMLHSQLLKRIILIFNSSSMALLTMCISQCYHNRVLMGLYGPVSLHILGNRGKYSPSCQTNTENQLFQYWPTRKDNTESILLEIENVCILTQVGMYNEILPEPSEIPWAPPLGFPSCSGYISPYIPPRVIIQIQYSVINDVFNS